MAAADDAWIGREEIVASSMDPWPARALQATLGLQPNDAPPPPALPPLWSWLYFLDAAPREAIGEDGHPALGGFMPPLSAARRMFAGGTAEFPAPLHLGVPAEQTRRILSIEEKAGATGPLVFVKLGLEVRQAGAVCVRETRDIVYLNAAPAPPAAAGEATPVPDAPWRLDLTPDPVLLMRFSALTFNAHRIHYDAAYARDREGYPERVVHGPLTALLLAELARLQGRVALGAFSFRARAPLFVERTLHLRGSEGEDGALALSAYDADGRLAMSATAR